MSPRWSQRFHDEFGVVLPPDVMDWLDGGIYEREDGSQLCGFNDPLNPESVLDPTSATIWGGQMLPDTLPVLSNGCGDVLALRFGTDDHLKEVIRWNHEGGGWRPYGATLAEAVLADVVASKVEEGLSGDTEYDGYRRDEWAARWVRESSAPTLVWSGAFGSDGTRLIHALLSAGVCEPFGRRQLCKAHLTSGLERRCCEIGGEDLARRLGVQWSDMLAWLFDTALIPERYRGRLSQLADLPLNEMLRQDWDRAARHAQHVRRLRPDLSWPYGVIGYAAERAGNFEQALRDYAAGAEALGTSDDMLDARCEAKFVLHRLRSLRERIEPAALKNAYVQDAIAAEHPRALYEGIRRHWLARAEAARRHGDYGRAYSYYYNAGWDDYAYDDMKTILDALIRAAKEAGYVALHKIAKHHAASL